MRISRFCFRLAYVVALVVLVGICSVTLFSGNTLAASAHNLKPLNKVQCTDYPQSAETQEAGAFDVTAYLDDQLCYNTKKVWAEPGSHLDCEVHSFLGTADVDSCTFQLDAKQQNATISMAYTVYPLLDSPDSCTMSFVVNDRGHVISHVNNCAD